MTALRFLDILGFVVGLIYLYLEYKASIWLWLASIVMPAIDMFLYFEAGLYADFGMAVYYVLAGVYGWAMWRSGKGGRQTKHITHYKESHILPSVAVFGLLWLGIWLFLSRVTDSTVPVADAFTTALGIVALWAMAQKYAEQWLLWLAVDAVCCVLYVFKGIPFKAVIYGIYTVFAVFGYIKWLRLMKAQPSV